MNIGGGPLGAAGPPPAWPLADVLDLYAVSAPLAAAVRRLEQGFVEHRESRTVRLDEGCWRFAAIAMSAPLSGSVLNRSRGGSLRAVRVVQRVVSKRRGSTPVQGGGVGISCCG